MTADLHTHSLFSFDGDPAATPENMAESALAAGLSHLAVTDHCDVDGELSGIYAPLDKDGVFAAVRAAQETYRGRLNILFGVELGQPHACPAEACALLARYPYDIVIGSLHNLRGEKDFYYMDFERIGEAETRALFDRVLDEESELCDFEGLHVLGHLTYMDRYLHRAGKALDLAPHRDKLCRLLDKIVARGLTVELNTSVMAEGVPMPSEEVLRLYFDRGGRRVCLGSDAHSPAKIAQHFGAACDLLRACGFTELTLPTARGTLTYPIPRRNCHA